MKKPPRELLQLAARHLRWQIELIEEMRESGDEQTQESDDYWMTMLNRAAYWLDDGGRAPTAAIRNLAIETLQERAEDYRRRTIDYDDPDPPDLDPKEEADVLEIVAQWIESTTRKETKT